MQILTGQRNKVLLIGLGIRVNSPDCNDRTLSREVVVVLVDYDAFDEGAFFLFEEHSVIESYLLTNYPDEVSSQSLSYRIETESILLYPKIS